MNLLRQQLFQFQERIRAVNEIHFSPGWQEKTAESTLRTITNTKRRLIYGHHRIKRIGVSATMDDYEKRKLGIFNQLNFFQLVTGICIPVTGLFHNKYFPAWAWAAACFPAIISIIVLWLNAKRKYEAGIILYFICYPVLTSMVYMGGIHMGTELFFILYGILSVFFLQEISHMLFSVTFNMISYFMLAVLWSDHRFQLEADNMLLYLFNQFAGIVFIFYGLFLIKKENIGYQASVLSQNREIARQTEELGELNNVKNKLFSVIAHDLKTPMYSLRNLFSSIQQQDIPPKKIKAMLPDMINNLNYTTGLLENLLQWAKCQMRTEGASIRSLDITKIIGDIIRLSHLQAKAKQLVIETTIDTPVFIMADKDMIELVLRNLLSNAVKFTPATGKIVIGVQQRGGHAEIFVRDSGVGMGEGALEKISRNDYYTSNGTDKEPGTGLGLMLCKEFLVKNNSRLFIESRPGSGSTFSFSLPLAG